MASATPKLSGLKFLVEKIVHTDATATIMRIGDQTTLGAQYALKIIKPDTAALEQEDDEEEGVDARDKNDAKKKASPQKAFDAFLAAIDQARACHLASQKLGHPTCLKYHDFRTRRSWFQISKAELLMEFVNGTSLNRIGKLDISQWVLIARQVAVAVAHMHRRGALHGDLRPAHVMVSKSGQVKVLGYGRSLVQKKENAPGSRVYAAPEQLKDNALTEKTDLYSYGATFYHLLTGQSPNQGKRALGEAGKIPLPTALNPRIPPELNNVLVSCLQSQPERRPESMFDAQVKLDELIKKLGLDEQALRGLGQAEA